MGETCPTPPPPNPNSEQGKRVGWCPPLRLTTEFDSVTSTFLHKASVKLLRDGLAKLKLSFLTRPPPPYSSSPSSSSSDDDDDVDTTTTTTTTTMVSNPQLSLIFSKLLSFHYDFTHRSALLNASLPLGPHLRFSASHDLKAQQGEASVLATLPDPAYALELSSPIPSFALPRASLKFPLGELILEEKDDPDEQNPHLCISGILKGHILNGFYTAHYTDDSLMLRYCYKDEALSFIPSISLPSNALSFAFKRRFNPSNKLSYWYNFDANTWSAVYKHTYGKDFKFKAGYDSEVRLGWASLWVGDEDGKTKTAPMKMKVQFMLQVPQDEIRSAALMFRVKKRWDI